MLKEHGLLFFDKPLQLKNIKYENRPFEGTVSHSVVDSGQSAARKELECIDFCNRQINILILQKTCLSVMFFCRVEAIHGVNCVN